MPATGAASQSGRQREGQWRPATGGRGPIAGRANPNEGRAKTLAASSMREIMASMLPVAIPAGRVRPGFRGDTVEARAARAAGMHLAGNSGSHLSAMPQCRV